MNFYLGGKFKGTVPIDYIGVHRANVANDSAGVAAWDTMAQTPDHFPVGATVTPWVS